LLTCLTSCKGHRMGLVSLVCLGNFYPSSFTPFFTIIIHHLSSPHYSLSSSILFYSLYDCWGF
jgi:hypothetical protein